MVAPFRVRVYDTKIAGLFLPGGDAWEKTKRVGRLSKDLAIAKAPSRTGRMKAQHGFNVLPGRLYGCRAFVYNDADYARFVHEGTTGPIFATSSPNLLIRPAPHSYYSSPTLRAHVAGQHAQPWISEAAMQALTIERMI